MVICNYCHRPIQKTEPYAQFKNFNTIAEYSYYHNREANDCFRKQDLKLTRETRMLEIFREEMQKAS